MSNVAATKASWNTKPFTPGKTLTFELNKRLSQNQMLNIMRGKIPREMEDKWFIYYEDCKLALYCHN
jgi:hypothetical protein